MLLLIQNGPTLVISLFILWRSTFERKAKKQIATHPSRTIILCVCVFLSLYLSLSLSTLSPPLSLFFLSRLLFYVEHIAETHQALR